VLSVESRQVLNSSVHANIRLGWTLLNSATNAAAYRGEKLNSTGCSIALIVPAVLSASLSRRIVQLYTLDSRNLSPRTLLVKKTCDNSTKSKDDEKKNHEKEENFLT